MAGTVRSLSGLVIVMGLAALLAAPGFSTPGPPLDEGLLLVLPERVLAGAVPHRDFESVYPPGNLWVLASLYGVARPGVRTERAAGLVYRLAIALALFAIVRRRGSLLATGCALLSVTLLGPLQLPACAWIGGLACALWGFERTAAGKAVAGGLLSGLALLFRWDLAVAIACATGALSWGEPISWRRRWITAFLAGLAPLVVHLLVAGPTSVIGGMIVHPVLHSGPARRLPFATIDPEVRRLFGLVLVATAAPLVVGLLALRPGRGSDARLLLAVAGFAVGILPEGMQRADWVHLLYVGAVTIALLPLTLVVAARLRPAMAVGLVALAVWVLGRQVVVGPVLWLAQQTLHPGGPLAYRVRSAERWFPVAGAEEARDLTALIADVRQRSRPGDRVFVGPRDLRRTNYGDTFLYFLLPRLTPASYFIDLTPGTANRVGSRLAEDIASADLLLLTDRYDAWNEPNASRQLGSDRPLEIVRREFCPLAQHERYEILARCDRRVSRGE
jgi:hypothetical protein